MGLVTVASSRPLLAWALVLAVSSCGGSSTSSTTPDDSVDPTPTPQLFTTESGLECHQDLFEITQHEPGFAAPGSGAVDLRSAADDYWAGDDPGGLTEIIDPPVIRYENDHGETQLVLSFVEIDGLWRLDTSEACSQVQRAAVEGSPIDVAGNTGTVESAVVFLPDELSAYASVQPDLEQQRIAVLQPGEHGFDAVIVYRTSPQCGNLPDITVNGDQNGLHVTVDTPVSGDCDAMEYDRAIGLHLAPGFDEATITAE